MATLEKIRSKGPLVVIAVGLALFAFVAGDAWKILQPHQTSQTVGEVNGEKLSAQDFQKMVDEMSEVIQMSNGLSNLSEDQLNNVKDQVWQTYVNNKLIAAEADKLGLQVTDDEVKYVINQGTNPLLMQTPFVNQNTGRFDKDMLEKFLAEYANLGKSQMPAQYTEYYTKMGNFWKFIEKTLRQSLLAEKYQSLIMKSFISNPVSAQNSFDGRTQESDLLLAGVPYSSISDSTIKVSDSEIKDLYNKRKEMYKQMIETRNIRYIDVKVTPSDADRNAVKEDVTKLANQLAKTSSDYATFVRNAKSEVPFREIPVGKTAFPTDIASRLDSAAIDQVYGPYYNQADDSYNTFKVLAKVSSPDSIQFRQIQVAAETTEKAKTLADSIYNALKAGGDFATIAKKYGQTGEANWVSAQSWEVGNIEGDNAKFINALLNQPTNELVTLPLGQGYIILDVTNKAAFQTKYKVAAVKSSVQFSKETYSKAYNKFSQFVAQNTTVADIEKNAEKSGYTLTPRTDFSNAEHYVAGVRSTREALKWVFDAKPGEVSPLYECGDNDHMMLIVLDKINKAGYRDINLVSDRLKQELIRDKKAEQLIEKMKGFKSLAQVKGMKDAVSDSVKHVTFSAPAFISVTRANEPAISGVAAKTAVNAVSAPVKGNAGVYMIQVLSKNKTAEKFDAKLEEQQLSARAQQFASQFINDLYQKAEVVDKRYLYF